jgi:hypothetical protein
MDITEIRQQPNVPSFLKWPAKFFSYLFHPLFIPGYIAAYLLFIHPFAFAGEELRFKVLKLLSVVLSTTLFPLVTVLLLKQLGFVDSIQLKTPKERIIPIIASMIFYFWAFYVSKNQIDNPPELVEMLCSVFISSIIALTANNFIKISLHAISMGILVSFFLFLTWNSFTPIGLFLAIALLIAGITCTSRLLISDHTSSEISIGFATGILSYLIAFFVL